jgi:hypothetical protein
VLVPLGTRSDPAGSARAADLSANAAMADLLTEVGRAAHPDGGGPGDSLFTVVGLRRMAWPRAAVLRAAGWILARKTLQSWASRGTGEPIPAVAAAVAAHWAELSIDRAAVRPLLDKHLADALRGTPAAAVEHVLRPLTEAAPADKSDMVRARTVFTRFLELIGRPGHGEKDTPYKFDRLLASKVREVSAQVDAKVTTTVLALVEQPGVRLAGAEEAVSLFRNGLAAELEEADREATAIEERAYAVYVPLVQLLAPGAGTSGSHRIAPDLAGMIRQWAIARIEGLLARACANVFRGLVGNVSDAVRELTGIRNQFRALQSQLDASPPAMPDAAGILQSVFPQGGKSMTEAASRITSELAPEDLREFENGLQARIRHEFRGVASICSRPREAGPGFLAALADQASKFLDARTPRLNATQVLAHQSISPAALRERMTELVTSSAPVGLGPERTVAATLTILGTPVDDAATRVAQTVGSLVANCTFQTVPTVDDIVLYQEAPVSLAALPHLTGENSSATADSRRPLSHARTDVSWTAVGVQ